MTRAQLKALLSLDDGPGRLHATTGGALIRFGYAEEIRPRIFELTESGRRVLERRRADALAAEQYSRLSAKDRERRERAQGWIRFSGNLNPFAHQYVRLCIGAVLLGEDIPPSGINWQGGREDGDATVVEAARRAVKAVLGLEEKQEEAGPKGEVTYSWHVQAPNPAEKAAVRAEAAESTIVDLRAYRKARR